MRGEAGMQAEIGLPPKPLPFTSQPVSLVPCIAEPPLIWEAVEGGFTLVSVHVVHRPAQLRTGHFTLCLNIPHFQTHEKNEVAVAGHFPTF